MLTPEAQLMAAYQAAQQQPMMPQIPMTYNTATEEAGMGITSTGIAAGTSAANFATYAPGFLLPMLASGAIATRIKNSALASSRVGTFAAKAFSPVGALLNPFGAATSTWAGASKYGFLTRAGLSTLALAPGLGLAIGAGSAISYASNQAFQGAQDYVATRQLMREMPGIGFGATSVLGGGSGLTDLSSGQISQANQMIQSVGGRYGLDASASRNLLSNLSQTGMIDTSSVKAMSQSYQKALSDFKLMAKTLQIDIDQTIELYKGLDQLGLRGNAERRAVLSRASSTASLTGKSLDSVMQTVAGAITAGNSLGLSSYASSNVATRAMAVSALAERAGALPESYLNRVGGYDGYTNRMIELELGMSRSSGAMRMMANMYDTSGRFRSDNLLSTGARGRSGDSFFRNVDPYELDRMSREMSGALPSLVLARVDAIQSRHGAGSVRANREQFRFLQTMGIEDPQEQLAFLMSARTAGAGQFTQGMQASTDRLNAAPANAAEALSRESLNFSRAISLMTSSLTTELRAFGEAMQAASEEAAGRIAVSRGGLQFSPTNFRASTQQLGIVSEFIRQGKIDPFTSDPMAQVMDIEGRYRNLISRGLGSSIAFTGITRAEGQGMLTGRFDRNIARFGYDLPEQIENAVNTVSRSALATVFGEDVFRPRQTDNDILGGIGVNGNEARGAYRVRSGADPNRGQVTFGTIMENVARLHGQYYDARTNTILRTNAFGERQFSSQYGDQLNDAMNQFRGDVSGAVRSQMRGTLISEGIGLGGSVAAGALAGAFFGGIPGAAVGGLLGGLAYSFSGNLSGSVRTARENLFGSTTGSPRLLSGDIQREINTSQGSARTRDYLTRRVFGKSYDELSNSQRMYFDNYMRTNQEASDFAGIVPAETDPLSRFELATLGLNIAQEGVVRNVFTTTRDVEAAESRRNIFRSAIEATSEQGDRSTAALREIIEVSRNFHQQVGVTPSANGRTRTVTTAERLEAGARRLRLQRRAMESLTDEDRRLLEDTPLDPAGVEALARRVEERENANRTAREQAVGFMTESQRQAFESANYVEQRQMLREMAAEETRNMNNRIVLEDINLLADNSLGSSVAGALLAVGRAGGQSNQQALQFALARTTEVGSRLTDLNAGNIFSIFSGRTDRTDYTSQINQSSRNASVFLLAQQQAQGTDQTPEEIIAAELQRLDPTLSDRAARRQANRMAANGRGSLGQMSPEASRAINNALSGAGGFTLPDVGTLAETVRGSEDIAGIRAATQYGAAFEEVSRQNLDVVRQQRAGDFMRIAGSLGITNLQGTGAEVFANIDADQVTMMQGALSDKRAEIRRLESDRNADPAELERLRREALQLEEFINLSGSSESDTGRMVDLASNVLFNADGSFNVGAVGAVTGTYGFAGAGDALNTISVLTSTTNRREQTQALQALIGEGEGAMAAFADRVGLDENASIEDIRREVNTRLQNKDTSFLMDLVDDVLKSTDVTTSDAAREDLRDRGYQAMIDIAAAVTSVPGGRAMRTVDPGVSAVLDAIVGGGEQP